MVGKALYSGFYANKLYFTTANRILRVSTKESSPVNDRRYWKSRAFRLAEIALRKGEKV